jgi:hypothetical protein
VQGREPLGRDVCTTFGQADRAISHIAAGQRALITRAQLKQLGIGRRAIDHAIARGRLHTMHRGIYSMVPFPALPPLATELAAILACGDTALLSHRPRPRHRPGDLGPPRGTTARPHAKGRPAGPGGQRQVGNYTADFLWPPEKMILEIDAYQAVSGVRRSASAGSPGSRDRSCRGTRRTGENV